MVRFEVAPAHFGHKLFREFRVFAAHLLQSRLNEVGDVVGKAETQFGDFPLFLVFLFVFR